MSGNSGGGRNMSGNSGGGRGSRGGSGGGSGGLVAAPVSSGARNAGGGARNTPPSAGVGSGAGQMGGSRGGEGRSDGGSAGVDRQRHKARAERNEHPFLWDNFNDRGKTCLSFGYPPKVQNNRWQENDRDTGHGRCKFNRDCRVFDGPEHTDPKPERIRDRLNSRGNLVLVAAVENVPIDSFHPQYKHHDKPKDPHFQRAPQPPFKGAGGHRTPFWSSHIELNLGHGQGGGLHPNQQCKGEHGRTPFGKAFAYTEQRQKTVRETFDRIAGRAKAAEMPIELMVRRFQPRRVKAVVARQMTEAEATRVLIRKLTGQEEPDAGSQVPFEAFETMYRVESDGINDDGFFALLLHNEWS